VLVPHPARVPIIKEVAAKIRLRGMFPVIWFPIINERHVADIVAFLLSSNGYPAGSTALDTRDENLRMIKLDTKR
jgi:hypothetical protein